MSKTLIIAIHGKGSTAETSRTIAAIKSYFKDSADIVTPTYKDSDDIETTKKYFDTLARSYKEYDTVAVIGMSLGGYWAKYLANKIKGSKYVGLNPSFNFYDTHKPEDRPDLPITIYVAKDDDVVDPEVAIRLYSKRGKVNVLPSGGHRLLDVLKDILPSIKKDIYKI